MGRFARGALLGLLFVLAVGVWPAHANVSGVSISNPSSGEVMAGSYSSTGSPSGFTVALRGFATTNCSDGWASASFTVEGPSGYRKVFTLTPAQSSGTWSPGANWATQALNNGNYTVNFDVTEVKKSLNLNNCAGQTGHDENQAKLANPPETPVLESVSSSSDPPRATIKWKKNPEDDIVSYHIIRTGPDGTKTAVVGATGCGGVFSCDDTSFPADYSGTYSYKIVAYRAAPDGTGEDCGSGRCVKSNASDTKSVTLTKPTPTPSPSPTDSPTGSPSSTPNPGGGGQNQVGGGSTTGPTTRPGGSGVLSFGNGGGGGGGAGFNEFYSGTFDTNLPYEPKTLVIGGGRTTAPNGRQVEAASLSDEPPNYRTIMLPVAGGLLAFLSAAHVRRLLIHF
jgi:hypothetical protein